MSADLPELREHIRARRAALAGFMEQGAMLALDCDVLTITPRSDIYIRYLTDNCTIIARFASEFYGREVSVKFIEPTGAADRVQTVEPTLIEAPPAGGDRASPTPQYNSGPSKRAYALAYARRRWRVFPCVWIEAGRCSCGKLDCNSPGKHPLSGLVPRGVLDASGSPDIINNWWTRQPKANIAIAAGQSGLIIFDIDPRHGGDEAPLCALAGDGIRNTIRVLTPSGGRHFYYQQPLDGLFTGYTNKPAPGIDVRGGETYVIAPGSNHLMGEYRFETGYNPGEIDLLPCPPVLADLARRLSPQSAGPGASDASDQATGFDILRVLSGVPEGERNDQIFRAACSFRATNTARKVAMQLCCEAAVKCDPAFPRATVEEIVNRVYKKYAARPGASAAATRRIVKNKSSNNVEVEICVTDRRIRDMSADALKALRAANAKALQFFQREGVLVRLRFQDDSGPKVEPLSADALRGVLDRTADWIRTTMAGVFTADPPLKVVKDLLALPAYEDIPWLKALATTPFFARGGRFIVEPGYDIDSGVYLHLEPGLVIPSVSRQPTQPEVNAARDILEFELLGDFPFDGPSSRAYTIAAIVYPLVREIIDSNAPMLALDATTPGSGKGLLADIISLIATGRRAGAGAESKDIDETRKRITSLLLDGQAIALFDNIKRKLADNALAAALTADPWMDRVLGLSKIVSLRNRTQWIVTANQLQATGEMARRMVRTRLESSHENPEERTDFRHPDLRAWTREHRGELIHAGTVLVQNWIARGQPLLTTRTLGSFERWAQVLGGILEPAGIVGFLEDRAKSRAALDSDTTAWREFVAAWAETHGVKPQRASDLLPMAEEHLSALFEGVESTRAKETRLGKALVAHRGRVFGEYRIGTSEIEDEKRRKKPAWCLTTAKPQEQVGEVGETPQTAEECLKTLKKSSPTRPSVQEFAAPHVGEKKPEEIKGNSASQGCSPTSPTSIPSFADACEAVVDDEGGTSEGRSELAKAAAMVERTFSGARMVGVCRKPQRTRSR